MVVKERGFRSWTGEKQPSADSLVIHALHGGSGVFEARPLAVVDRYDYGIDAVRSAGERTTVLFSFRMPNGVIFPAHSPIWQSWLPEVRARVAQSAEPRNTVAQQIAEIQEITGLTDEQLAAAFPGGISRETVNRWRNRPESNLRPENLYRLGLLHGLSERMQQIGLEPRTWLFQALSNSNDAPYDLICRGELALVHQAVERIAAGESLRDERMAAVEMPREWDSDIEDEDDDGDWIEAGPEESSE